LVQIFHFDLLERVSERFEAHDTHLSENDLLEDKIMVLLEVGPPLLLLIQVHRAKRYHILWRALNVDPDHRIISINLSDHNLSFQFIVKRQLNDFGLKLIPLDKSQRDIFLIFN
tara:strand:- start:121 stop:462 length:342 start_codon:yes stop_codon:yes gene_type:complete